MEALAPAPLRSPALTRAESEKPLENQMTLGGASTDHPTLPQPAPSSLVYSSLEKKIPFPLNCESPPSTVVNLFLKLHSSFQIESPLNPDMFWFDKAYIRVHHSSAQNSLRAPIHSGPNPRLHSGQKVDIFTQGIKR